jgi:hypothetical protein
VKASPSKLDPIDYRGESLGVLRLAEEASMPFIGSIESRR